MTASEGLSERRVWLVISPGANAEFVAEIETICALGHLEVLQISGEAHAPPGTAKIIVACGRAQHRSNTPDANVEDKALNTGARHEEASRDDPGETTTPSVAATPSWISERFLDGVDVSRFVVVLERSGRDLIPPGLELSPTLSMSAPLVTRRLLWLLGGLELLTGLDRLAGSDIAKPPSFLLDDAPQMDGDEVVAVAIADCLLSANGRLVVGIEGAWGAGKTSLMRQIERYLRVNPAQKAVQAMWFLPWKHASSDAIWAEFAIQFEHEFASLLRQPRRVARITFARLKKAFHAEGRHDLAVLVSWLCVASLALLVLNLVNPTQHTEWKQNWPVLSTYWSTVWGALATGSMVPVVAKVWASVSSPIGSALRAQSSRAVPDYTKKRGFSSRARADLEILTRVCCPSNMVTCVFIDDLDRCEIPIAADLLAALNLLVAPSANVVFVLGLDRVKVAAGIAARHEKILPFIARETVPLTEGANQYEHGLRYGSQFVEKLINASFPVPRRDAGLLSSWLRVASRNAVDERQPDAQRSLDALIAMAGPLVAVLNHNPRLLKQWMNGVGLRWSLLSEPAQRWEPRVPSTRVTPAHVAKLTALLMRWPELNEDLKRDHELLLRLEHLAVDRNACPPPSAGSAVQRWSQHPALLELLSRASSVTSSFFSADLERLLMFTSTATRPEIGGTNDGHTVSA